MEPTDEKTSQDAEPVDKIKVKGAANKFFNANPELLAGIQSDINGRERRLKVLQDRNKFLGDQMKMLEGQLKLYSTLYEATGKPVDIPDTLTQQITDLNKEITKNGSAYQQEFNNVKPLPPDPSSQSVPIEHNGKDINVDPELLKAMQSGNPKVIEKIHQMSTSEDPAIREQAMALAHAAGESVVMDANGQNQQWFPNNNQQPQAPSTPAPAVAPSAMQVPTQNSQTAVGMIQDSLKKNAMSTASSGPNGAVEFIRRQLLSNIAKDKK